MNSHRGPALDPLRAGDAAERGRLAAALPPLPLSSIRELPYETSPHGYRRLTLERTGAVEIVALHWPAGSRSPLHGHAGAAALLKLVAGAVLEDRFVPIDSPAPSFSHQRCRLAAGGVGYLPSGSFHAVEALEESWGLHAYTPQLDVPTEAVAERLLAPLREAWWRGQDPRSATLPYFLL